MNFIGCFTDVLEDAELLLRFPECLPIFPQKDPESLFFSGHENAKKLSCNSHTERLAAADDESPVWNAALVGLDRV